MTACLWRSTWTAWRPRQFSVGTGTPHVIVGAGIIVAGLVVRGVAIVVWVVRILHAAATGLVVTFESDLDLAYGAVMCVGAGMEGMAKSRHRDIPSAVLSICSGIGAVVLGVAAALGGL